MADWVPLRDHLRADLAVQLDEMILHDPDPFLIDNRERILEVLVDKAELVTMRRILAEREHAEPAIVRLSRRLNGSAATVR